MPRKPLYKTRETEEPALKRLVNRIPAGRKFGDWTTGEKGKKPDYITCTCICGTVREVHAYSLSTGKSVSCGCKRKREKDA